VHPGGAQSPHALAWTDRPFFAFADERRWFKTGPLAELNRIEVTSDNKRKRDFARDASTVHPRSASRASDVLKIDRQRRPETGQSGHQPGR
jgi:hypothetical protein